jgi:predicted aldo/keto reductase-like oxidoreductase
MVGGIKNAADRFEPGRKIDFEAATQMFEHAVENGINYFDTAYVYQEGQSEMVTGRALKPHREKVLIATKLPAFMAQEPEDFDRYLGEQLERLDTDYLDVYLAHAMNRSLWEKMKKMGMREFFDRIRSDGRVRHVGFSFHDDVRAFKQIVDEYDWEIAQIQYNYFDEHYQAGREGLEYAAEKGLGIVIMEPIRGGKLADPVPARIKNIWDTAEVKRTPAEWALRWVWDHPEVSSVLSGMSNMDQLVENIRTAKGAAAGSLTPEELDRIQTVNACYRDMMQVDCTACGYCMPCPTGVNIPACFSLYNDFHIFEEDRATSTMLYNAMLGADEKGSACVECGECEEKCPQNIEIKETLKIAHETLHREGDKPMKEEK